MTTITRVLINDDFKAIRHGQYVEATAEGEFILDAENPDDAPAVATLQEVATKNKIKVKGKKKEEVLEQLFEGFATIKNLPSMDEKPDTLIVKEIVDAGHEAGDSEEDMLIAIMTNKDRKIPYKRAMSLFNKALAEGGYKISNKQRADEVNAILEAEGEDGFDPEGEYSAVEDIVRTIIKTVSDTNSAQATRLVRRYCKDNEIEFPKPPKRAAGGLRLKAQNFMLENVDATKEEFAAFVNSQVKKAKDEKAIDRMWSAVAFAKKFAKAYVAAHYEEDESAED